MQEIKQAVTEATKVALMAVREVDDPVIAARPVQVMPKTDIPGLKLPTFDWKATEKCHELWKFWNRGKEHVHD